MQHREIACVCACLDRYWDTNENFVHIVRVFCAAFNPTAIRLSERVFHRPPTIALVPVACTNFPFYWISRIEQHTLRAIGMPFGSTLGLLPRNGQLLSI